VKLDFKYKSTDNTSTTTYSNFSHKKEETIEYILNVIPENQYNSYYDSQAWDNRYTNEVFLVPAIMGALLLIEGILMIIFGRKTVF